MTNPFGVEIAKLRSKKADAAVGAGIGAASMQVGGHYANHAHFTQNRPDGPYAQASVARKAKMHVRAVPQVARQLVTGRKAAITTGAVVAGGAATQLALRPLARRAERKRAERKARKAEIGKSAFGVTHIIKVDAGATRDAIVAAAHAAGKHSGEALRHCPKCTAAAGGPGSQRARMSMRAWESQTAAARRSQS